MDHIPNEWGYWSVLRYGSIWEQMTGYGKSWALGLAEWLATPRNVEPGSVVIRFNGEIVHVI